MGRRHVLVVGGHNDPARLPQLPADVPRPRPEHNPAIYPRRVAPTSRAAGTAQPSRVVQDLVSSVLVRIPELTESLIVQILRDDEEYARGRLDTSELRRSFSDNMTQILMALAGLLPEGIGRASCRERVSCCV